MRFHSEESIFQYLLPEHIGKDSSDDEDNGEEEQDDEVGEHKALDLLPCGEASKAGEGGEHRGDDEDDVGGVHVEPAPQQLVEESLVFEGPYGEGEEDEAGDNPDSIGQVKSCSRSLLLVPHPFIFTAQFCQTSSRPTIFSPKIACSHSERASLPFDVCLFADKQTNSAHHGEFTSLQVVGLNSTAARRR